MPEEKRVSEEELASKLLSEAASPSFDAASLAMGTATPAIPEAVLAAGDDEGMPRRPKKLLDVDETAQGAAVISGANL
eukprot:2467717-Lingulodinium_polyedra.AAC.1